MEYNLATKLERKREAGEDGPTDHALEFAHYSLKSLLRRLRGKHLPKENKEPKKQTKPLGPSKVFDI